MGCLPSPYVALIGSIYHGPPSVQTAFLRQWSEENQVAKARTSLIGHVAVTFQCQLHGPSQ